MTAKVQPSKQQWDDLKIHLIIPADRVKLRIDGYDVTINVERRRLQLLLVVYVNGRIDGGWLIKESEEARRFYHPKKIFIYKPAERRRMKAPGRKKINKELGIDPDKSFTSYYPYWTSFDAMRRHFVRQNDVIEVVE